MKNHLRAALPFALLAATAFTSITAHAQAKMVDGLLVNDAGMTLYTFDRDTEGKSACIGACASLWRPAKVTPDAKPGADYSIVLRDDGSKQWAYQGKPLYTYSADRKPGDMSGDNFKEVWHVVR